MGLVSYLAGNHPRNSKTTATWPGIGGHESSQLLFFRGAVGRFLFLWKGGWGKGSRNEIWNEPIYANILEVDLDLFGCIRDPWCPCETCSSQISHGVNVVSTRLCRKLNMHRRCWEKLGAWPRVAPSKKITLQSMDPTWCLPVNADPTWTCFLSFLPSQFLKEREILKGKLPSWKDSITNMSKFPGKTPKSAAFGWLKTEQKDRKTSLDGGFASGSDPS